MSCLGVTGKPMVVTDLGWSGNGTDGLDAFNPMVKCFTIA